MAKIQPASAQTAEMRENLTSLKQKTIELEEQLRSLLKGKMKDAQYKVQNRVEEKPIEKPIQSVAAAFGAGMLIGAVGYALMRRNK